MPTIEELIFDALIKRRYSKMTPENYPEGIYVANRVGTPQTFDDDLFGRCTKCDHPVYYRPYKPYWLPLVCMPCGMYMMKMEAAN